MVKLPVEISPLWQWLASVRAFQVRAVAGALGAGGAASSAADAHREGGEMFSSASGFFFFLSLG